MRARHRHFNPHHVGATAAFDARYGITVSNNSLVDTWFNRVGSNNATQSATVWRPIFLATGGNSNSPSIEFGGDDDLWHSISLTVAPNLIIAVATRTGGNDFGSIASFMPPNTANFNNLYARYGSGTNWGAGAGDSNQTILNAWRICSAKPANTATSNSATTMWTDGANEITRTGSRYAGDAQDRRRIGSSGTASPSFMLGRISQVIAIPADVSNPLRRRLEHASAFSFKIACS
jgi:hypothetical protein